MYIYIYAVICLSLFILVWVVAGKVFISQTKSSSHSVGWKGLMTWETNSETHNDKEDPQPTNQPTAGNGPCFGWSTKPYPLLVTEMQEQ